MFGGLRLQLTLLDALAGLALVALADRDWSLVRDEVVCCPSPVTAHM